MENCLSTRKANLPPSYFQPVEKFLEIAKLSISLHLIPDFEFNLNHFFGEIIGRWLGLNNSNIKTLLPCLFAEMKVLWCGQATIHNSTNYLTNYLASLYVNWMIKKGNLFSNNNYVVWGINRCHNHFNTSPLALQIASLFGLEVP